MHAIARLLHAIIAGRPQQDTTRTTCRRRARPSGGAGSASASRPRCALTVVLSVVCCLLAVVWLYGCTVDCWLLAVGCWLWAVGCFAVALLAVGCCAVGCWLLGGRAVVLLAVGYCAVWLLQCCRVGAKDAPRRPFSRGGMQVARSDAARERKRVADRRRAPCRRSALGQGAPARAQSSRRSAPWRPMQPRRIKTRRAWERM